MAWRDEVFGIVIHKNFSKFKFSRLAKITREYFLTTRGLVIRGGSKGPGDLLEWDKIKEPGTADGLNILGLDLAGTVKFSTPITLTLAAGRGGKSTTQEFPQMSTDFYYKLLSAWHVAKMFDDESTRTQALLIWKENKNARRSMTKGDYLKEISTRKIKKIFLGNMDYKNAALEMYQRGKLKYDDLKKTNYEIEEMVKEYIRKKEKIGFKSEAGNEFRNSMRSGVNPSANASGTTKGSWGNTAPHIRFGQSEGRDE